MSRQHLSGLCLVEHSFYAPAGGLAFQHGPVTRWQLLLAECPPCGRLVGQFQCLARLLEPCSHCLIRKRPKLVCPGLSLPKAAMTTKRWFGWSSFIGWCLASLCLVLCSRRSLLKAARTAPILINPPASEPVLLGAIAQTRWQYMPRVPAIPFQEALPSSKPTRRPRKALESLARHCRWFRNRMSKAVLLGAALCLAAHSVCRVNVSKAFRLQEKPLLMPSHAKTGFVHSIS